MTNTRSRRTVVSTLLALATVAGAASGSETPDKGRKKDAPSPYVVLATETDDSIRALFERYPELSGSWEELARFNLLRTGHPIEIPDSMLDSRGVLAKVASFYGEAEVKRSFDTRFIPALPNLLLREGDEIRTWRGAGLRILFEDGNYVLLKSQSRATLVSLGTKQTPATSRLKLYLKEGSIWSQMEGELRGRFEVQTAAASTIIRGTEFRVKVEPGEATRVEVLDGRVEFEVGERRVSVGTREGSLAVIGAEPSAPAALPPSPRLAAPLVDEVIRDGAFDQTFRWESVDDAEMYSFEIARDDRFFDVVIERRVSADVSVRVQGLDPGTYFWRVATVRGGFEGPPSETRYFVFVAPRP
jgi:hypothetical protein